MDTRNQRGNDTRRDSDPGPGGAGPLLDLQAIIARIEVRVEQATVMMDIAEGHMVAPPNRLAVLAALGCANECDADISELVDFLPVVLPREGAVMPEPQRLRMVTRLLSRHGEIRERLRQAIEGEWNVFEEPRDFAEWEQAMEWYQHCFRCRANLRAVEHCRDHIAGDGHHDQMEVAYLEALIEASNDLDLELDEFIGHPGRNLDLTSQEDRDETYGVACRALLEMQEISEREIRSYDARVPVRFSPTIERVPELTRQFTDTPLGPNQFAHDYCFNGDERGTSLPADLDPLACVVFNHQGVKYAKSATEPYPKGYPFTLAQRHMNSLLDDLEEARDQGDVAVPDALFADARTMESAAELFLHDIWPDDIDGLVGLATVSGVTQAAVLEILDVLTFHDAKVSRLLAGNANVDRSIATAEQAAAIIAAAREVGLEPAALRRLAESLGHEPQTLGIDVQLSAPETAKRLVQAALDAGFPDDAVANLARTLGVEFEPPPGSWLRAAGPSSD